MVNAVFKFKSKVWIWPGLAPWYMVTLPILESKKIKQLFGSLHRGWRSLPVNVKAGKTDWKTSIFLDNKQGAYILPIKVLVRKKEKIKSGDVLNFSIEIMP